MANCTERNCTTKMCHPSTSQWKTGVGVFFVALNIFLSITASLGNAVIFIVLHKKTSLHPPTKLLFKCLSVTDLCVGLISQPLHCTLILSHYTTKMKSSIIFFVTKANTTVSAILCGISVGTSTAISLDRLLALLLGMRYRQVVTLSRARVVVTCIWKISVLLSCISFLNFHIFWITVYVGVISSLALSLFSYMKIYFTLRQHQAQIQAQFQQGQRGGIPLNMVRYKKTVSSILWVQLMLLLCYIPFVVVSVLTIDEEISFDAIWAATVTLVYLNSSLNPILYCWKIKEVRQEIKNLMRDSCLRSLWR